MIKLLGEGIETTYVEYIPQSLSQDRVSLPFSLHFHFYFLYEFLILIFIISISYPYLQGLMLSLMLY